MFRFFSPTNYSIHFLRYALSRLIKSTAEFTLVEFGEVPDNGGSSVFGFLYRSMWMLKTHPNATNFF